MEPQETTPGTVRLSVPDAESMHAFGRELAGRLRAGDLVVLTGPLGAGKTTLARGLGEGLGVRGAVTSPTFVLARTHPSTIDGPPLVHVDAYRLGSAVELDDLDIDFPHSIVVVEWGRGMLDGIAESWLDIEIERPLGASQAHSASASASASAPAPASAPAAVAPDDDLDDDLDLDEPRTVTITPVGPRWVGLAEFDGHSGANRV